MDRSTDTIDLRSDTVTRPTAEMRESTLDAEVGDDGYADDPTVRKLETEVATMLGMDAAMFVPSGTMGNQIAVHTHTTPGQEVLVDRYAHVYNSEAAGMAQHSNVQVRPLDGGSNGVPSPDAIREAHAEKPDYGTGLLVLENTHNRRGGVAVPPAVIAEVTRTAHDLDIPVHLDGARIFNAAIACGVDVDEYAKSVDTVMFCFSKGLGAPMGSILVGPDRLLSAARQTRKLFGGQLRQVGFVAAACRIALSNVDRLSRDHEHARLLAEGLEELGVDVREPQTNIVLANPKSVEETARRFVDRCREIDVLCKPVDRNSVRLCTHADVSRNDIERALDRIATIV